MLTPTDQWHKVMNANSRDREMNWGQEAKRRNTKNRRSCQEAQRGLHKDDAGAGARPATDCVSRLPTHTVNVQPYWPSLPVDLTWQDNRFSFVSSLGRKPQNWSVMQGKLTFINPMNRTSCLVERWHFCWVNSEWRGRMKYVPHKHLSPCKFTVNSVSPGCEGGKTLQLLFHWEESARLIRPRASCLFTLRFSPLIQPAADVMACWGNKISQIFRNISELLLPTLPSSTMHCLHCWHKRKRERCINMYQQLQTTHGYDELSWQY